MGVVLMEQFIDEVYSFLDVKGRTVVDIVANIGDSAMYFVLNGAQSVVALEPYPRLYRLAKHNLELNRCADEIVLINAGASGRDGEILLDTERGSFNSDLAEAENGVSIPLYGLETITRMFHLERCDSILKVDCEGSEYDVLLCSSPAILRRFERIQIEYHHGRERLIHKLRDSGFDVSFKEARYHSERHGRNPSVQEGYIFATRKRAEN